MNYTIPSRFTINDDKYSESFALYLQKQVDCIDIPEAAIIATTNLSTQSNASINDLISC